LDAFEAERERPGALTGATGSFFDALEAPLDKAGTAVGAASTSLAGFADFFATGFAFLIALVALGSALFLVSVFPFAIF
jgi:hypothetical protein